MIIKPYQVEWLESFVDPAWTEYELRSLRDKIDRILAAMASKRT